MNATAGIDTERERVYQKAEQMDAQLQRMSEDLKVTIFVANSHWYKYQFKSRIITETFINTTSH